MISLLLSVGWRHQLEKRSESEMWSRYNGVLHRSAQNYWPLSRFFLSPHSSATTSTTHQQSVRPGFPGRVGNCESYCCPAAALFHRSHSSPFRVICSRRCSHASIKITNGHLRRWDGDILNNWRASKHISLCNNFLLISNFPAYHAPFIILHFICILQFGYWKKKPSELEVILNSPHKLDCFFPPSLHIFTAADLYPLEMDAVFPQWWAHIVIPVDPIGRLLCCVVHALYFSPMHSTSVLWDHYWCLFCANTQGRLSGVLADRNIPYVKV